MVSADLPLTRSARTGTWSSRPRQLSNLRAFTRLYGYVRYFHPSDEAAALDWNAFAIYGAGRVVAARGRDELRATLERLFRPIAPTVQILASGQQPRAVKASVTPPKPLRIAWQHQGVWPGKSNIYSSIRLHRKNPRHIPKFGHGYVIQGFDPSPYRGRKFRLEAYVRTQGGSTMGGAALWLRIGGPNSRIRFFDNMAGRKIHSKTWRKFTIRGGVSADAVDLRFGAMANGVDRAWVDGFKLSFADGKGGWVAAPLANPGFETGAEGGPPETLATDILAPVYGGNVVVSENPVTGGPLVVVLSSVGKPDNEEPARPSASSRRPSCPS